MDQSDLPWSDLPELVLATIAVKLSSPFAFSAFARVCRSWRSVARSAKFDFMAFQPPLLLILPSFPSATPVHLYSPADRRSYSAKSPALTSLLRNSYILTHHHGYIVAIDKLISNEDVCTPTVKNLCTDETYSFPSCPRDFKRGLLTSPPNSGSCMLILYSRDYEDIMAISYCRVGDPSRWHLLRLPEPPHSAASHDNTLYLSSVTGNVMVVAIDNAGSLNLVQVIETPCCRHRFYTLTVFEDDLVMIPRFLVIRRTSVYRLKLCDGREGGWKEGLGDGRSLFLCEEDKESGYYVWSGRMTTGGGVQGLKSSSVLDGEEDRFERKGFWVHPRDLERWGVKNMMV